MLSMGFVTKFVDTDPDFLMESDYLPVMQDWLGSVSALGWPGLAYFQVWEGSQIRPRVESSEGLADLNCFEF